MQKIITDYGEIQVAIDTLGHGLDDTVAAAIVSATQTCHAT